MVQIGESDCGQLCWEVSPKNHLVLSPSNGHFPDNDPTTMNRLARIPLLAGFVGLILAQTSFGLYPAKSESAHDNSPSVAVRSVTIGSQPTGCGIWLNDKYAGKTPLLVHVAVNAEGRCLRGSRFAR